MYRFAHYYIKYKHDFGPHEWDDRQRHLDALFETDESIGFVVGEDEKKKVYKHRVYRLKAAPGIIVMRFANDIDLPVERDFKPATAKDEPSCFVIIDNREGMRRVAIQQRKKAFGNPGQVAKILQTVIGDRLYSQYCYSLEIAPEFYPEDFYQAWERLQRQVQGLRIAQLTDMAESDIWARVEELRAKNRDFFDDSLMGPILKMAQAAMEENYKFTYNVSPKERKNSLYVDKTSRTIRNIVTYAAAVGDPIELVTSDGAAFRCYVDSEADNTDKIVCSDFGASLLETLFAVRDKDGKQIMPEERVKAEGEVLELMNQMKKESEDEEAQAV